MFIGKISKSLSKKCFFLENSSTLNVSLKYIKFENFRLILFKNSQDFCKKKHFRKEETYT